MKYVPFEDVIMGRNLLQIGLLPYLIFCLINSQQEDQLSGEHCCHNIAVDATNIGFQSIQTRQDEESQKQCGKRHTDTGVSDDCQYFQVSFKLLQEYYKQAVYPLQEHKKVQLIKRPFGMNIIVVSYNDISNAQPSQYLFFRMRQESTPILI